MNSSQRIVFMRRLSLFLYAGIPVLQSLDLMKEAGMSRKHARIHAALIADILEGRTLSDALARFPRTFDFLALNLVRAGESSGSLPTQLRNIAAVLERRKEGRERMLRVALYPAIVSGATIILTLFLTLYVFPKMLPLFKGFHQELPITTRVLIATTSFLTAHGTALGACIILMISGMILSLRHRAVRRKFERVLIVLPVIGPIIRFHATAFIAGTLSTLLGSGLGILPSLAMLHSYTRATLYADALADMEIHIRAGKPVADAFSRHTRLFPPVAAQLIRAGEYTGTLPEALRHVSDICEHYLKERSQQLEALAEPILMVCMGTVIGFVALAIITPIYSLTQSI